MLAYLKSKDAKSQSQISYFASFCGTSFYSMKKFHIHVLANLGGLEMILYLAIMTQNVKFLFMASLFKPCKSFNCCSSLNSFSVKSGG